MKTIVAPTDFSTVSLNAVNYAADMAASLNMNLYLVHIYHVPLPYSEVPIPIENITIIKKETEKSMEKLKEELTKRTGEKIKIDTTLRPGLIMKELEEVCSSLKPYAVVMGTQGTNAAEQLIFGSQTRTAMKRLEWPLIIVPPDAKYTGIKRIGLACDFKKVIETIPANEIKLFVKNFKAELHVIYDSEDGYSTHSPETVEESAFLQEMLEELHPLYHFLNNPDVEEAINKYSKRHQLDLLIVIPKKHTIWHKLFQKSHSKELVLHTDVPILSIHD